MSTNSTRSTIIADGRRFRDRRGRHVILRGVNLGGDCKVPTGPSGHTYHATDFADHRTVSFVGRPFPLDEADAAHVMAYRYDAKIGGRQLSYPQMSWGGNYRMPANAIMWTLFFVGPSVASLAMAIHQGQNVGTYLQDHYLGAVRAVAERVSGLPHVIGFDTLNEPGSGWIGQELEDRRDLLRGPAWSPLDSLAVASGISRSLPLLEGGERIINPNGVSIWRDGADDPFRAGGVWDVGSNGPYSLKSHHFSNLSQNCTGYSEGT